MAKLTKSIVEKTPANPARDVFVWDGQLPGFGVRIYPSGRRKYIVQYRTQDNRQRRQVLGLHGVLTAEQARIMAQDFLATARKGGDPAADKQAAKAAPTVRDLARDYLEQHAYPKKRPSSVKDDERQLNRTILPKLGTTKVKAVGRIDIEKLHNSLRDTPYAANRTLALFSKMFSLAVEWGLRSDNPVKGVKRFHEEGHERWLSDSELQRLWAVLEADPNRRSANAVKLLVLTGARRSEVLGATWDQFDLDRGLWTKPSHHTKQKKKHQIPLSKAALDLLSTMKCEAAEGETFLFPGDAPGKPITDIKKFWQKVRLEAEIEDVRLHDLRHTFASKLVSSGVSLQIVGGLLGHTQPQTTAKYAHLNDEALREAAELFGSSLSL